MGKDGVLFVVAGRHPATPDEVRREMTLRMLNDAANEVSLTLVVAEPNDRFLRSHVSGWSLLGRDGGEEEWTQTSVNHGGRVVVYDFMYLAELQTHRQRYRDFQRALQASKIPHFNCVLPSKDVIYQYLSTWRHQDAIPETVVHATTRRALRFLQQRGQMWVKPVVGSGGRDMVFVEAVSHSKFSVWAERFHGESVVDLMSEREFFRFLDHVLGKRRYMIQEHLPLVGSQGGRRVDFRVTLYRDGSGVWQVVAVTMRRARLHSLLTNFHAGGEVQSLTEGVDDVDAILSEVAMTEEDLDRMRSLALSVARKLSRRYPNLGVLGVDVGRTEDGRYCLYDFNSRPGRDVLTDNEVKTSMQFIAAFAKYLFCEGKSYD